MLTHLQIKNFTIIDSLAVELEPNMTVLTGETGAGKSIIIDTLELALGARADTKVIRSNSDKCDITAVFDITNLPNVKTWLKDQDMDDAECIVRRIITADGRSKSTINGIPCPQALTRELGAMLVNIHGQHEHQNLLKRDIQLDLLDSFAGNTDLCQQLKTAFLTWQKNNHELQQLQNLAQNSDANTELLTYQLQELEELNLQENELEELHQEHKQLSNAEELLTRCHETLELLQNNNLLEAQKQLSPIQTIDPQINTANELINSAIIQAEEANLELKDYLNRVDLDPEKLEFTEKRLNKIYDLARKHHVHSEELFDLYSNLKQKLEIIENATEQLEQKQREVNETANTYKNLATQLTQKRQQAAEKLSVAIMQQMYSLNMEHGKFAVDFTQLDRFSISGQEQIEFLVTTNPGQPLQSLKKVASGGELSRISLAIQVITAQYYPTPTLIFDEVDVGIGGKTAAIVGNLLKQLGANAQILCVTHLPQVAAQGQQHIKVQKQTDIDSTLVQLTNLNQEQRIQEIARMLGGLEITESTLAHAKEMLIDTCN